MTWFSGRLGRLSDPPVFLTIIALLITPLYFGQLFLTFHQNIGFPLDDTYITLNYAKNIGRGCFMCYNEGEHSTGSSTWLWVIINSIGHFFTDNLLALFAYLFVINVAFYFLFLRNFYKICVGMGFFSRNFTTLLVLVMMIPGFWLWGMLSGMEVILFLFLFTEAAKTYLSEKKLSVKLALLFALLFYTRLHGVFYFAAVIVHQLVFLKNRNLKSYLLPLSVFLLCITPYLIYNYSVTGYPFASTVYIKTMPLDFSDVSGAIGPLSLRISRFLISYPVFLVMIPVLLAGLALFIKRRKEFGQEDYLFLLFFVFLALAIVKANSIGYQIRLFPESVLVVLVLVSLVLRKTKVYNVILKYYRPLFFVLLIAVAAASVRSSWVWAENIDSVNSQQVLIAGWINENVPSGSVIAINDVGAMKYLTDVYVLDLMGLTSPETLKIRMDMGLYQNGEIPLGTMEALLREKDACWVIIYPNVAPSFFGKYRDKTVKIFDLGRDFVFLGGREVYAMRIC